MQKTNLWEGFQFDAPTPLGEWLRHYVTSDHRYVFLGTSVLATAGVSLSTLDRPQLSFLKNFYELEIAMYGSLLLWLVISVVALIYKLTHWGSYEKESPFVRPRARRVTRYASYGVWLIWVFLVLDRLAMGLFSGVMAGVQSTSNPTDGLESAAYMVSNSLDIYVRGIQNTIIIAIVGTVCAFAIATILVFMRVQRLDRQDNDFVRFWKVLGRFFSVAYSTVIRSTPMMVQTFIIYYSVFGFLAGSGMSVSEIGEVWSAFTAGIVIMSINSSPYVLEVLRSGIEAVDYGQVEAARSLGFTQWQAMTHVIFPQGLKNAIPALSNEFIINIKDSSILSVIGVLDLMFATTTVSGMYFKTTPVYLVAAAVYFVLAIGANRLLTLLEKRLGIKEGDLSKETVELSHGEH